MKHQTLLRIGLGYLALVSAQLGFWALLAPQSFYDSFPGLGRSWVSVDGPYNEHLIRDVGALNLALMVGLIYAAVRLTRELVTVAAAVTATWGIPHLIYHLVNTDDLSNGDLVASLGGLFAFSAFSIMLFVAARNPALTSPDVQPSAS